ncbi:hypothetical protein cand_018730 [Cryptosporidium andersoni]|uniref:Transmembrane protein n=1 Tax=Cryptosporidium andersoni TaxID=117008 RepID=A0A1J4M9Z3_9CRYT|nr:hypothetical protein cand_018730 [Cryptosporidium andersoni]
MKLINHIYKFKQKVVNRFGEFHKGRYSWRLKEWFHLQAILYLVYSIGSYIFAKLVANSDPKNPNYDHFVQDPDNITSIFQCSITPLFKFIPIPGSYVITIIILYTIPVISLIMATIAFVSGFCFGYFSKIPRSYFFTPSKKTRFLGFGCKVLPVCFKIFNIILFLLLSIPFIYISTTGACYRRLVRFERNQVYNCRIWMDKCAKDTRIFGPHLQCSLRKNFKYFPSDIVEDPTIGENSDILSGGPVPLLCPICNEIRMDKKSLLYKGETYVDQLKLKLSQLESHNIKQKQLKQNDPLSLIQLESHILSTTKKDNKKINSNYSIQCNSLLCKKETTKSLYLDIKKFPLFSNLSPWIEYTMKDRSVKNNNQYSNIKSIVFLQLHSQTNINNDNKTILVDTKKQKKPIGKTKKLKKEKRSDIEKVTPKSKASIEANDIVSIKKPIQLGLEKSEIFKRVDPPLPIQSRNPSQLLSLKYKNIMEKYAAAAAAASGNETSSQGEYVHRPIYSKISSDREDSINSDKSDKFISFYQFSGDRKPTSLTKEQTLRLSREFEAARYQIQVSTHEGSTFSRSTFIFLLTSIIFWTLIKFSSSVILSSTQIEGCFYVSSSKNIRGWSKLMWIINLLG